MLDQFSFLGGRGRVHDFEYEQGLVYGFTKRGPCYAKSQNTGRDLASHQLFVFSNSQTTRRCEPPTLRARTLTKLELITCLRNSIARQCSTIDQAPKRDETFSYPAKCVKQFN